MRSAGLIPHADCFEAVNFIGKSPISIFRPSELYALALFGFALTSFLHSKIRNKAKSGLFIDGTASPCV
jgi:hypothetical protein